MFHVDANHVTGLHDIPHAFIGGANAMNDNVLALASGCSLRSMDVEMALMHNWIPVDGINVLDYFPFFVLVNDDVVLECFFDLGQEVCVWTTATFLTASAFFGWNSK
jgi:hypothetical protein